MSNLFLRNIISCICIFPSLYSFTQSTGSLNTKSNQGRDTTFPEYVEVSANPELKGGGLKNMFIGKNYRNEWTKKIRVPVLHLNTDYGGLVPVKQGGGKETKSLQVKDKTGKVWSLRSVEKFPENAIPGQFRKTVVESLVKDAISASYPFGALSMGVLSKAARVPYLSNILVYIPDDPALGKFRSKFKNTLALMEERDPAGVTTGNENDDDDKTISTQKMVEELASSNNNKVNSIAVLQARILDNYVMDFDRHEGQWVWLKTDSANGNAYYPVPKDRDQVFYTNQGLLPNFARGKSFFPELQGFRKKAKNIRNFNRAGRNFDRFFLAELTEEQWSGQIDAFLKAMTDSVIEAALNQQPPEIQKYAAQEIIHTLKFKRKYFKEDMMKYYRFLSRTVAIVGSNEREQFDIVKNSDGSVAITVYRLDDKGDTESVIFHRLFDRHITREIQLYGLEGDDKFVITGDKSPIRIRIIGGPGNDQVINNTSGKKAIVYDVVYDDNSIEGNGNIKNRITTDPQNNTYTRLGYYYSFIAPGLSLEYSSDGGVFIGPKIKIITQGFRKTPFGSSHTFIVNRSLSSSSYHFKYGGEFIKLFGKTDLMLSADFRTPSNKTNFFGYGNNTVNNKLAPEKLEYYHTRYDIANAYLQLRDSIATWFELRYGGTFQYFKLRGAINSDKYISTILPLSDPKYTYAGRYYAGPEVDFIIDTRNNKMMPVRGLFINGYGKTLFGLNKNIPSNDLTQIGGSLNFYKGILPKNRLVFATAFGASTNIGNFEFEQAQYLGFKQNLRGYRIQRFAGRSRAYNNTELRLKVANINAYLFPASFGILAFNDIGRVWFDNEKSNVWHDGYGAGIWLAPVDKIVITGCLTYSKEEKNLALFTFGYQF